MSPRNALSSYNDSEEQPPLFQDSIPTGLVQSKPNIAPGSATLPPPLASLEKVRQNGKVRSAEAGRLWPGMHSQQAHQAAMAKAAQAQLVQQRQMEKQRSRSEAGSPQLVRKKEDVVVQTALTKIARARAKGKTNVNLSPEQMEALERRKTRQPEPPLSLASPLATPASHGSRGSHHAWNPRQVNEPFPQLTENSPSKRKAATIRSKRQQALEGPQRSESPFDYDGFPSSFPPNDTFATEPSLPYKRSWPASEMLRGVTTDPSKTALPARCSTISADATTTKESQERRLLKLAMRGVD